MDLQTTWATNMPLAQTMAGRDSSPLEIVVFDMLRIAEAGGGGLKDDKRHAGDLAVLGRGLDRARPERDHLRRLFLCRIRLRPGSETRWASRLGLR